MRNKQPVSNKLNARWLIVCSLILLVAVLMFLSPTEKTLGANVKLVYLHFSLIFATLFLFGVSLVLFFSGLISKKENHLIRGNRIFTITTITWSVNLLFSMLIMKLIWGSIAWQEPKFTNMVTMFFVLMIGFTIAVFLNDIKSKSAVYSLASFIVVASMFFTTNVVHPKQPILGSASLAIKLFPVGMTIALIVIGILISQLVGSRESGVEKP